MIATLKELCIKQSAAHIVDGRLKTASSKLDPESSNLVFAEFMKFNEHEKFSESCQHIKNILTLTKVQLYGTSIDENMCNMLYEQNIKELALEGIAQWNMFHLDREKNVDICAVLKKLLNPEGRRKLEKLEINGNEIIFLPGWAEKLADLLPSIKTLSLLKIETNKEEIHSFSQNFLNLTELEIPKSKITTLDGISKMSKLTILNISEIDFENTEDIKELFELKNLEKLVVQGEINGQFLSNFMHLYMKSGKCLLQLEHLICSYCHMTEEMIQNLLDTHKNLNCIDLIGTPLQNRAQITGRGLTLFTMGTFKDCLNTAEMYVEYNPCFDYFAPVLSKLCTLLHEQYDQICQQELSECFEFMCKIIKSYSKLRCGAAVILEVMCRDERAEKFSFVERQHLIHTIISTFEDPREDMLIEESIWEVLSNQKLLEASPGYLNKLCEYAASEFSNYLILEECPPESIMVLLANNLDNMSTERAKRLANNTQFMKDVLEALNLVITGMIYEEVEPENLTTIIEKLYVIRDDQNLEVDKECVEVFCDAISSYSLFQEDIETKIDFMTTLGKIIGLMHEKAMRVLWNDKAQVPIFMDMFYNKDSDQQRATIILFLMLFLKANGNNVELLGGKSLEEVQQLLVEDVRVGLSRFEKTEDVFDGLKWLLEKCENSITKAMCQWMIEEFRREEERPDSPKPDSPEMIAVENKMLSLDIEPLIDPESIDFWLVELNIRRALLRLVVSTSSDEHPTSLLTLCVTIDRIVSRFSTPIPVKMIDTLRNLCIKQTAEHIVTGRVKTAHQTLDVQTSNLVFEELLSHSEHLNFSENCQYVKNILTVTKIELTSQIQSVDDNFCKMIYEQSIQELGLYGLFYWEMFHLKRENPDEEGENQGQLLVDIPAVLEKMLNPESFKNLKKLEITGCNLEFLPGWVQKIAPLLPSLETLSLVCSEVEEDVVQSIYKNFPNLTELEISKSKISNLNGISKLYNLKSLNISEIEFEKKEDLYELFELKNLKVLVIEGDMQLSSGGQKSKTLIHYLESGKCLPQLEQLECSFCDITEEMLRKLLDTHPNLKTIDLMGTPLENRAQITGRGLKLLTMGTFADCLYTIDIFQQRDVLTDYTEPILVTLCEILDDGKEEISRKELSGCLELMCEIIRRYWDLRGKAAEVLEKLCRDNRAKFFTFAERQRLIFTIIQVFEEEKDNFYMYNYFIKNDSVWSILSDKVILATSPKNIDAICEYAAIAFCKLEHERFHPFQPAMTILAENLDNMSTDRGRALARNSTIFYAVLNKFDLFAFYQTGAHQHIGYLATIIRKLYKMRENRSEEWAQIDEECVEAFHKAIRNYRNDLETQSVVLRTLGEIIGCMNESAMRNLMEDRTWFRYFINTINFNHSPFQKVTVALIYSVFSQVNIRKLELPNDVSTQKILLRDVRCAL
ncbi:unnamed protein product [Caenorhabditis brenneri]